MNGKQSRRTKKNGYNFALTIILPELLPSFNPIFAQDLSCGCTAHRHNSLLPQTSVICVVTSIKAELGLWNSHQLGFYPRFNV